MIRRVRLWEAMEMLIKKVCRRLIVKSDGRKVILFLPATTCLNVNMEATGEKKSLSTMATEQAKEIEKTEFPSEQY